MFRASESAHVSSESKDRGCYRWCPESLVGDKYCHEDHLQERQCSSIPSKRHILGQSSSAQMLAGGQVRLLLDLQRTLLPRTQVHALTYVAEDKVHVRK